MKKEDREFLKELQEMLSQDTVGQANPRFWVVMQDVRVYGISDDFDISGQSIYCDGEEIGDTLESVYEFLTEYIDDSCLEYTINFLNNSILIDGFQTFYTVGDILDFMKSELYIENIDLVNYRVEQQIVPNTMFLTLRECKEHIKANKHHYNDTARPYAMTAWRSPQIKKLYKILQKTEWENI